MRSPDGRPTTVRTTAARALPVIDPQGHDGKGPRKNGQGGDELSWPFKAITQFRSRRGCLTMVFGAGQRDFCGLGGCAPLGHKTPIDTEVLPGNPAGALTHQQRHRSGDIRRGADAPQGGRLGETVDLLLGFALAEQFCIGRTR